MAVSLPDRYVLLLQSVVDENKLLREQMKQTVDAAKSSIDEIKKKVDTLNSHTAVAGRRVRQTGRAVRVPKMCRNNVRLKMKSLKAHDNNLSFKFNESVDSEHHNMLVRKVTEELAHDYGGVEKCPWSVIIIKEAFKTYFRSSRASHIRCEKGIQQAHNTSCRRRNRKDEKLARRLKQLDKASWSAEKVSKVADILRPDYMSSEESENDENQQNNVLKYNIHRLPWESKKLRLAKKKLDKLHKATLSGVVKRRLIPREVGTPSTRPKPASCPDWAYTQERVPAVNEDATAVAEQRNGQSEAEFEHNL